uniref:BTB domain-containing protein n=1 Tax=Setaria italica TaxID=4555 RepID=K3YL21_SETIT
GLDGRPTDFRFQEFRLDYEKNKHLEAGHAIFSDPFSAGGHMWRISCFPRGINSVYDKGEYLSVFVEVVSKPWVSGVSAVFEVFLMDKNGEPSVTEGHIRIVCGIMVVNDRSIPVPPSDIVEHLCNMLDSTDGADVSFIVDSETFHAHRAVLAARSPVFRAELLGSMAEATAPSITLHDIAPATFKLMLRFMYTDTFPVDGELLGDCPTEMIRHLLAAADRYALDRLKLMCAQKLWDNVSVNTVAATLACAEMYNCLELKIKCIDFFAMEKNFRKAVLTDGFVQLVQQFPFIIVELRKRPAT